MQPSFSVWIGFDPRQTDGIAVSSYSAKRNMSRGGVPIYGLVQDDLRSLGLYWRRTEKRKSAADGPVIWDLVSDAAESTQFSNTRFLTQHLAKKLGVEWGLFMDCDMLVRADLLQLLRLVDEQPGKALYCVKHDHRPQPGIKMDGQIQSSYLRKNWSSLMLFRVGHPAHTRLSLEMINEVPGRDLHRLCWLEDDEIGEFPIEWNFLVRHNDPATYVPKIVHFTEGLPSIPKYENDPFADEWRRALYDFASVRA